MAGRLQLDERWLDLVVVSSHRPFDGQLKWPFRTGILLSTCFPGQLLTLGLSLGVFATEMLQVIRSAIS